MLIELLEYSNNGHFIKYRMEELCFKLLHNINMNMNKQRNGSFNFELNVLPRIKMPGSVEFKIRLIDNIADLIQESGKFDHLSQQLRSFLMQIKNKNNANCNSIAFL